MSIHGRDITTSGFWKQTAATLELSQFWYLHEYTTLHSAKLMPTLTVQRQDDIYVGAGGGSSYWQYIHLVHAIMNVPTRANKPTFVSAVKHSSLRRVVSSEISSGKFP